MVVRVVGVAVEVAGAVVVEAGDGAAGGEERRGGAVPFDGGDADRVDGVVGGRWSGSGSCALSQPDGDGSAHISSV